MNGPIDYLRAVLAAEVSRHEDLRKATAALDAVEDELYDREARLDEIDALVFTVIAGEGAQKAEAQRELGDLLAARVDGQLRAALRASS